MTNLEALNAALIASPTDAALAMAHADAVTESAAERTDGAGFVGFHPEMGEKRPAAHMEARLSHYGEHHFVDTPLELKGRGITYRGKFQGAPGCYKNGWNQYKVTEKAFEKLQAQYRVASEMLL